ncbi:ATP-binding cassette domain-containing protein [Sporichthya brevicatena]|uniref:ATP-binding cassette domain-containing protein n=1 Tax=Sporichthya brevicatena TaxID=171442 RepID=A0ABN1GST1_9ACTN
MTSRTVTASRLRGPATWWCLAGALLASVGFAVGAWTAGRLAERPSGGLIVLLAVCLIGAGVLDMVGRAVWSTVVDRAEGRLRADLLAAALHQPLPALSEQAVGEVLDRVDDDTHQLGELLREVGWETGRTLLAAIPMWVVAGLTWWPAWILFPVVGLLAAAVVRPLTEAVTRAKVAEEIAWTDHAAVLEEAVAARDDLRASRGQAFVLRRCAEASAVVHRRVRTTVRLASRLGRRAGVVLHLVLAGIAVSGILLVAAGRLSTAALVTLYLVSISFVGQVDVICRYLPDLQAGLGALRRIRTLLEADSEPTGGAPVPAGPLDVRIERLHFAYPQGPFALSDVSLTIPAGRTLALVGRTGSGKSTLVALLSRAIDPPPGSVFLGGVDVRDLDLDDLRRTVGVAGQRTEILVGTLAENIALFADVPRPVIERAVDELGLTAWVAGLPDGLDTQLGPDGTTLSAGEEQLVAFARLLVRDVRVVVLDEATARMDRHTEARVVAATARLLAGRTGILVAHRMSTTTRADTVAVLDGGRVLAQGPRVELARNPGPYRDLLRAAGDDAEATVRGPVPRFAVPPQRLASARTARGTIPGPRRTAEAPPEWDPGTGPSLARSIVSALRIHPRWGIAGAVLFLLSSVVGPYGVVTGLVWGKVVASLAAGGEVGVTTLAFAGSLIAGPVLVFAAMPLYMRWWWAVHLRVRLAVLRGQTLPRRLPPTPPGEVVARAMDADRFVQYADRWVDFVNGVLVVLLTVLLAQSLLAGGLLLAVTVLTALTALVGAPIAGRSAARASETRARFGRSLVSTLDAARTVKLAAATPQLHRHLLGVDSPRVGAAIREHRVRAVLDSVPPLLVQCGMVLCWLIYLTGGWGLATALLVTTALEGFDFFGRVTAAVVTEAPGVRAWKDATCRLAAGADLMTQPDGVDLVHGKAPAPDAPSRVPLSRLDLDDLTVVHPDGTVGVAHVNLSVARGQLVLVVGSVGSGKSSLLAALAGLAHHQGRVRWNGVVVSDPELFLRPSQVSYVAQVPRVLSGTFADNVRLDHPGHSVESAVEDSRLALDVSAAGGLQARVGHRGVRLSGGQAQRVAFARALAANAELVVADDVSSALDARTELELWRALRMRGSTVVAATSKAAALAQADVVVVLDAGTVVAIGTWDTLAPDWAHLAG